MKRNYLSILSSTKLTIQLHTVLFLTACIVGCNSGTDEKSATQTQNVAADNSEQVLAPAQVKSPFVDVTSSSGVDFQHDNGGTGHLYMPEIMGAGGALFDADGDGDLDLYLVQGGTIDSSESAIPLDDTDRLLRNDLYIDADGNRRLKFTDITQTAGIPAGGYGMGVATGDIDNDGDIDLYVTNLGVNRLLKNRGDGTFEDISQSSGTDDDHWSVPATFFDMDNDGDLDLYSGSYVDFRIANHKDCFSSTGLPDYCSPHSYSAIPDRLFENKGDGTFEDITAKSGIRKIASKALGVISGDFNADGYADLYVANDGIANQLWINQTDNTFVDTALFAGCAVNYEGSPEASMGVDAADVDGDGDEDLFVTHLRGETNTLYVNHGDGTFEDRTIRLGLAGPSIPYTGFGTAWLDIENDGKLDLLAVNGAVTVEERLVQMNDRFPYHQPNQLFRNLSEGSDLRFEQYPVAKNDPFSVSNVSRGAMFGDLDNDGDLDVVITNNSGPTRVLKNVVGQKNSWIGLRPLLKADSSDALGATVKLTTIDGNQLMRRVRTSGSYVSASDPRLVFGLGEIQGSKKLSSIVVHWPNGLMEEYGTLPIERYHDIVQGTGKAIE